ncbi:MAG: efflux RND transporter permease subunit [Sandaracinus sp.]
MQWLAEICVKRPVFTWVLVLLITVVGGSSFFGLGVDRFPNIDVPIVVVTTVLPGASPEQVEREVSDPIEEAISSVSGIDELRSNSYEGLSVVMARFLMEKDMDVAAQEVRDRVNRILSQLPEGIDQPRVERVDPSAAPVMQIALISDRSPREVTEYADTRIRRMVESLDGVGGVAIIGGQERIIEIRLDTQALAALGLTPRDVQMALAQGNIEIPGGNVDEGARTMQLRVRGRLEDAAEFGDLVVTTRDGRPIRIRDVATVADTDEQPSSLATLDGRSVVIVQVQKQSGTNTVAIVDALTARVQEIRASLPPSYDVQIVRDESEFIRNAIAAVEEHLVLGGFFAALVVLLFLWNGRSTVIAALAIPTSIIGTFALINVMGLTLNIITLLALTLAVGIVIDDAIVVLENIVRWIEEKGYDPRRAAVYATKEIGLAVLATTLSLVAVFLPIAFMSGIIGRFMSSFGLTMSFSIMVSLFVSFTLTPMLCSRWLTGAQSPTGAPPPPPEEESDSLEIPDPAPGDRGEEAEQYLAWARGNRTVTSAEGHGHGHGGERGGLYGRIERGYMWLLGHAMRHRWVVGIFLVIALGSIPVLGRAVSKTFLPLEDESRFEISIRAPEGTSLAQTQLVGERIARDVRALDGVAHTLVTVGSAEGDSSGRGPNQATIFVALTPPTTRDVTQDNVITTVRNDVLPPYAGEHLRTIVSPVNAFGGGSAADSASIQFVINGPDIDQLSEYSAAMLEQVRQIQGVVDADVTLVTGQPAYEVHIDRARASDLGVNVADIANALRLVVAGVDVGTFADAGEQYDVRVRADLESRTRVADLEQIRVPSVVPGRTVRLADIARIVPAEGPASIQHLGRQRQVTVYCNTVAGTSEATVIEGFQSAFDGLHVLPGYRSAFTGRSRELGRAARSFGIAVLLSFIFMYLVLAAQFESWIHPITILISLPLTIPFALLSLLVLNQSVNIYSALGILVLFGVVKKNSILVVDHTRELRRKGLSRADAVMIGNRDRLRPILMTTIAFVAGMIPLLVSSGAGAGTNRAMGSVIAGGQVLSLLLTLVATPVVYTWFDDLSHSRFVAAVGGFVTWPIRKIDQLFGGNKKAHAAPPAADAAGTSVPDTRSEPSSSAAE